MPCRWLQEKPLCRWCRLSRWRSLTTDPGHEPIRIARNGQLNWQPSHAEFREPTIDNRAGQSNSIPIAFVRDEEGLPFYGGFVLQVSAIIEAAMATQKLMLSEFPWDERHRVEGIEEVLTPALVVYPDIVASNIARTLQLLGGDADRWRVHIKTAKLAYTLRMLVERGVRNFKCATTLELLIACRSGAADVLLALSSDGRERTACARNSA